MKNLKIVLGVLMIAPTLAVAYIIGELRLAGYSPWESILMALGGTLPFVLVFGIAFHLVERSANRPPE